MAADDSTTRLLVRCALRDQQAFLQLYDNTSAKLFGIILRIVKKEAWAEEALQEAFIKIWQRAADYRPAKASGMTWLVHIARNQALDALRGRERQQDLRTGDESELLHQADPAGDPSEQALMSQELQRLLQCMGTLTDEQKRCVIGLYYEGHSYEELAKQLDSPMGTIKTWLRRSLQRIRECLGR